MYVYVCAVCGSFFYELDFHGYMSDNRVRSVVEFFVSCPCRYCTGIDGRRCVLNWCLSMTFQSVHTYLFFPPIYIPSFPGTYVWTGTEATVEYITTEICNGYIRVLCSATDVNKVLWMNECMCISEMSLLCCSALLCLQLMMIFFFFFFFFNNGGMIDRVPPSSLTTKTTRQRTENAINQSINQSVQAFP